MSQRLPTSSAAVLLLLLALLIVGCASSQTGTTSPEVLTLFYQDSGSAPLIGRVRLYADGCISLFNTRWNEYCRCLDEGKWATLSQLLEDDNLPGEIESVAALEHDEQFADYESLEIGLGEIDAVFAYDSAPPQTKSGPLYELLRQLDFILNEEFRKKYDFKVLP